jgi:hypothetical protein
MTGTQPTLVRIDGRLVDVPVIYHMACAMRDALRAKKAVRRIADWLGFHDAMDLMRERRRELGP